MAGPRVTVVGSINMDLVASADALPRPGETVLGVSFATASGGKGGNQAIAAARAGASVTMVGAVGSDAFAAGLLDTLRAAGVDTAHVERVDGPSGIAAISVDAAGENSIIVIPGANASVRADRADDVHAITSAQILVMQLEIPMDSVISAARAARSAGVPVLLNPSPVRDLAPDLIDNVSILVLNEGEAAAVGADALHAVPHVVTTLGAAGARYRGPDGVALDVLAPRVEAVDTTGAGDAFTGALAVAWAEGLAPRHALRRACAAGALATTVRGASISSPTRQAIDEMVARTYAD